MEIETQTHNWNEVNINEMAQLIFTARRASPFWRRDRSLDWFRQFIHHRKERFSPSFVILVRSRENLVGLSTVISADPTQWLDGTTVWRAEDGRTIVIVTSDGTVRIETR